MWRNRIVTTLFSGSVLLVLEFVSAAPPASNETKPKRDAIVNDDHAAKANGKSSSSDTQRPADDESTPEKIVKTEAEWRKILTPGQFHVTRKKWTEPAGTGLYAHTKKDGIYHCICCGEPLFDSKTKFESGTGWPSFFQPIDEKAVTELEDISDGSLRIEVQCSRCDAHLGHVFSDGPRPTGHRYCMNSASLKLVNRKKELAPKDTASKHAAAKDTKPIQRNQVKKTQEERAADSKNSP